MQSKNTIPLVTTTIHCKLKTLSMVGNQRCYLRRFFKVGVGMLSSGHLGGFLSHLG